VAYKFSSKDHWSLVVEFYTSKIPGLVFVDNITFLFRRDSTGIPSIVRKCVAEVERRGMNEVGIYRVSGVASEIQALKASFDAGISAKR